MNVYDQQLTKDFLHQLFLKVLLLILTYYQTAKWVSSSMFLFYDLSFIKFSYAHATHCFSLKANLLKSLKILNFSISIH